ncbi:MAG: energy-coupling factor transporter ATPase [Firmicutes bacterium]|nr:energy-coupling factor transporter ATPase [Bacillota bacterium]
MVVKDLGYRYAAGTPDEVVALEGVNLVIRRGEFLAVIGPNGSGKSTLARHLNGLLLPTQGTVTVDGLDTRDPAHLWTIRQTVGMVFQNPDNQIVATVVEEDVAFGLENLAVPTAEMRRRVEEALALVGMTGWRRHAPHLLSGGQKQRVAIAGALALRPRCLVLDEATAMLDPRGRAEVLATVRRLNRDEGLTVVLITHFMEEAVDADRVLVMDKGRVVLDGPPAEVFRHAGLLRDIGLDVPQAVEVARLLETRGHRVPPEVLTVQELVEHLCPSRP